MSLGDKIKYLRTDKGIERAVLAETLGISYHALSKYETSEREPDYETVKRIADYFEVTTDYLLGRTPKKEAKYIFTGTNEDEYDFREQSEIDRATSDLRQALDIAIAKGKMTKEDAIDVIVGFHKQIELWLKIQE